MNTMLKLIGLSVLLISSVTIIVGQNKTKDVYEQIPSVARKRLVERLNLRVEYEKTAQWGKLYDLWCPRSSKEENYIKTKEEYIKINSDPDDPRTIIMIDFVPKIISSAEEFGKDTYMIEGCATFNFKGKIKKEKDIILAHLVENDWYFSSWGEVYQDGIFCKQ